MVSIASTYRAAVRALQVALIAVLPLCALAACTLDDSRDLCCDHGNAMRYTYRPYGLEAFDDYISSLRHFLFSRGGHYIGEVPPGQDLKYQLLDLPQGNYTMVTIGNSSGATITNHADRLHITDLALAHAHAEGTVHADELYWGVRHFDVDRDGIATDRGPERSRRFAQPLSVLTTEMNNIHCHLNVHVEWANVPDYIGTYTMELDGVPTGYNLDPDAAVDADGFVVPVPHTPSKLTLAVPMLGLELNGEFTSLRFSNEAIPTLRLRFGDIPVGPDIDLAKAFRSWGWYPSRVHVQRYAISVRLYADGTAILSPLFDTAIDDWIDGGTFG